MRYFACTREEHMPAWYELDVADRGRAIVIRIVPAAWEFICKQHQDNVPGLKSLQETHQLSPYVRPAASGWGFGQALMPYPTEPGWVGFRCQIPTLLPLVQENRDKPQWQEPRNVAASLQVLAAALLTCRGASTRQEPQLLEFDLHCGHGQGRWTVFAGLSPAMCAWVAKQPETSRQPEICECMENAHRQLFGRSYVNRDRRPYIHATIRHPAWISLCCPGDACELSPEDSHDDYREMDWGYGLHPHNMDTPMQQLTMIVGLAAMHKLARAAGF